MNMKEKNFVKMINEAGGLVYIVGGYVRDALRCVAAADRDYVVTGISEGDFRALFPRAHRVGKGFPVYLVMIDGNMSEVAFARRDTKTGRGYRGFEADFSPDITIEEDLFRRDTTMNSMAVSLPEGRLIDPFGGADDIKKRVIRATSECFTEDPVRALRAARQGAQFGFVIAPGTIELMHECREELACEPAERFVRELTLALSCDRPSIFFRTLLEAGILDISYPMISAMVGRPQPEIYHPEGDVFNHAMESVDRAAAISGRVEIRFAALVHDIGKVLTPENKLPRHIGHDKLGAEALAMFNRDMTLPRLWLTCAKFAAAEHMRAHTIKQPGKIVDLLERLERHKIGFDGFKAVAMADRGELPDCLERHELYLEAIRSVGGNDAPPSLSGTDTGEWVRMKRIEAVKRIRRAPNHRQDLGALPQTPQGN